MSMTSNSVDNGVNVEALLGAREALTEAPEAAKFQWRATCEWVTAPTAGPVENFSGLRRGAAATSKTFTFDADHPQMFASEDNGATPVEIRAGRRSAAA